MRNKDVRLEGCSFVKTVLMMSVVIGHCCAFYTGNWLPFLTPTEKNGILIFLYKWVNSFHIYAFTLVSGYLFFYLRYEKGKYCVFLPFVKNKARRLLLPYALVCVCWVIPCTMCFQRMTWEELFWKYFLGISPDQLWFLLMLFWVFLAFWLLSPFMKDHTFLGGLTVTGFYVCGILMGHFLPNIFCIWTAFQYVIFFWVGFKMRQFAASGLKKAMLIPLTVLYLLLFASVQIMESYGIALPSIVSIGMGFLIHLSGAVVVFEILQIIAGHGTVNDSAVGRALARNSMLVYLLHQQIIYFSLYILNGCVPVYAEVCMVLLVAVAIPVCIGECYRCSIRKCTTKAKR